MRMSIAFLSLCISAVLPAGLFAQDLANPADIQKRILKLAHDTKGVSVSCADLIERTAHFYFVIEANGREFDEAKRVYGKDDAFPRPVAAHQATMTAYRTRMDPFAEEALAACQPKKKTAKSVVDALEKRIEAMEPEYFAFARRSATRFGSSRPATRDTVRTL